MNEQWSAVLLAGVHDWGGCALNKARLRPLVPVANRPVIEHVLSALDDIGIVRAAICANGHGAAVRRVVGDVFAERVQLRYHNDSMPRGPAGCVKDAASGLAGDSVLVVEASVLPCFDIEALLRNHVCSGAALTIAAQRRRVDGESSYAPVGLYAVSRGALGYVSDKGFRDIKEGLIPTLHEAGLRVDVHSIDGAAPRLHGISSYFAINDWAVTLAGSGAWDLDGYAMQGSAIVHVDSRIDPSARLLGPVIVGRGAVVRPGAIVVGPTSLEPGCDIGEGAVVARSAVWDGGTVAAGAQMDRCVVADRARVPSGARFYNDVCLASASDMDRGRAGSVTGVLKVGGERSADGSEPITVGSARGSGPHFGDSNG